MKTSYYVAIAVVAFLLFMSGLYVGAEIFSENVVVNDTTYVQADIPDGVFDEYIFLIDSLSGENQRLIGELAIKPKFIKYKEFIRDSIFIDRPVPTEIDTAALLWAVGYKYRQTLFQYKDDYLDLETTVYSWTPADSADYKYTYDWQKKAKENRPNWLVRAGRYVIDRTAYGIIGFAFGKAK